MPEPARSDLLHAVEFPLENKTFVMDQMDFDVLEDDGITAVLSPLRVSILHSGFQVQLDDRLRAMAEDVANIEAIRARSPDLAEAVEAHAAEVAKGVNSKDLRRSADRLIAVKSELFGLTNAGCAHTLVEADAKPEVDTEEITGKEGRILTRLHVYKERDRKFAKRVRDYYRHANGGKLKCEACDAVPVDVYGDAGDRSMEAHHKIPIEELQPDSIAPVSEVAMVCATCHRVIHSAKPCLTIEQVRGLIEAETA